MEKVRIEQNLFSAINKTKPNQLHEILSLAAKQEKNVYINVEEKQTSHIGKLILSAAMVVMILFGSTSIFMNFTQRVIAVVSLDVNPSVEIAVGRNNKVKEVIANNEDGVKIIDNMDLKGSDIKVTMNALVGSMLRNGYLSELRNSILITVDSKDEGVAKNLEKELLEEVEKILNGNNFNSAILAQTVKEDSSIKELANTYHITEGKAQLINEIATDSLYQFEDLVELSINELNLLRKDKQSEQLTVVGQASDKEYIGHEKALAIALEHAGVNKDNVYELSVELEYERGLMIYDVEFENSDAEWEYDINAISGKIINAEKEEKHRNNQNTNNSTNTNNKPNTNTNSNNNSSGGNNTNSSNANKPNESNSNTTKPSTISSDQALSIALNHFGINSANTYDVKVEYDSDDNEYEIDFKAGGYEYEVDINASTGNIIKVEKEEDDDYHKANAQNAPVSQPAKQESQSRTENVSEDAGAKAEADTQQTQSQEVPKHESKPQEQQASSINSEQAKSIALGHAGVSNPSELDVEFDSDDNKYEIDFKADGYEYEYEIDASNGSIIKAEKEVDD